jgi:putative transcriptional regulator
VRGELLIAAPTLLDPNFARTVVLIADFNDEGAMGVVLNRPAGVTVGDAAPDLEPLVGAEEPIFTGGPVQPTAGVVLAEYEPGEGQGRVVFDGIALLPGLEELAEALPAVRRTRIFAGYAGWGAGQLDGELEQDAWVVAPADEADPFREGDIWSDALERRGGAYRLLATMPQDPSQN